MYLKVDVEGGKVYFKKSKDGPEDKYYVHNKSTLNHSITNITTHTNEISDRVLILISQQAFKEKLRETMASSQI